MIIAIDGPAGAGKSTVASLLAGRLGFVRVDTGAIYRAVAFLANERKIVKEAEIADLASALDFRFDEDGRAWLENRDVSLEIRSPEMSTAASRISALPMVRSALLEFQRRLGRSHAHGAVLEGRDIGTVVFPDAEVKVFLTASKEERARRRQKDLHLAGAQSTHAEVLREMTERDQRDSERAIAPLTPAEGAVLVDSTKKSLDQVVDEIVALVDLWRGERVL